MNLTGKPYLLLHDLNPVKPIVSAFQLCPQHAVIVVRIHGEALQDVQIIASFRSADPRADCRPVACRAQSRLVGFQKSRILLGKGVGVGVMAYLAGPGAPRSFRCLEFVFDSCPAFSGFPLPRNRQRFVGINVIELHVRNRVGAEFSSMGCSPLTSPQIKHSREPSFFLPVPSPINPVRQEHRRLEAVLPQNRPGVVKIVSETVVEGQHR